MKNTLRFGPVLSAIPAPLWAPEDGGAGGAADNGGTPGGAVDPGTQNAGGGGTGDQNGSVAFDPAAAYAALDEDTRKWLQSKDFLSDPAKLAKSAFEQEKLISGTIRVPGKDATPEEQEAFYNKMGRPEKPEGYEFRPPENLPEDLPYDADKANKLKTDLHKLGLSQAQASAIHDMYIAEVTGSFGNVQAQQAQALQDKAVKATEALEKLWGPIDGDTARANFELAGRVFTDVPGGQEFLSELQGLGLVGPNKEVLSEPLAKVLASVGGALFVEDSVLKGKKEVLGNPFAEGKDFDLTRQMEIKRNDPEQARSFITAAGKQPADFGL